MPQVNPAPSLDQAQPQLPQDVLQEAAAIPMDASPPPAPAPTAPSPPPPPASAAAGSDPAVTPTALHRREAAWLGGASQSHGVSVCQVDGCGADLARSKPYHRRHRVCETHGKSSETLVAGHTQRFCQMCSRFHRVPEFDGYMRSCRRRLSGRIPRRLARRIARLPPGFRGAI